MTRLRLSSPAAVFLCSLLLVSIGSSFYLGSSAAGAGYAWRGLPLDDAWIHLVYARSIARAEPFQYNPGEWETGSTSPLWALVLSPAIALGLPPVASGKLLGILFTAAASAVGYRLGTHLGDSLAGLMFAAAMPLLPYLDFAAVSCTEVPLFIFLLLVTIDLAVTERWRWAGAAAGLAILARPEGYLLLPLLGITLAVRFLASRSSDQTPWRKLLLDGGSALAPALLVITPWVGYCLWASGKPLPATFYSKAQWLGFLNIDQLQKIGGFLLFQPFSGSSIPNPLLKAAGAAAGTVLFAAGLTALYRSGPAAFVLLGLFSPVFYYALSLELPLGFFAELMRAGSLLNFYYSRYMLPGLAPFLLTSLIGLFSLERLLTSRFSSSSFSSSQQETAPRPAAPQRRAGSRPAASRTEKSPRENKESAGSFGAARIVLGVVFLILPVFSAVHLHSLLIPVYSWNCQNIEELDAAAGKWIAANLPENVTVASSDGGAIRYFGERRIVDLVGLNTHRLLPLLKQIDKAPRMSEEEARLRERFWKEEHIDDIAVLDGWHAPLLRGRYLKVLKFFELPLNTICGRSKLVIASMEAQGTVAGEGEETPAE
ncbi:MAG: hypothetical protein DMF49_07045 [Acidobacteria bacterium]|nr:MAG: hypothetical protein DMF49_07045 [Acidobacteriota bacterium]